MLVHTYLPGVRRNSWYINQQSQHCAVWPLGLQDVVEKVEESSMLEAGSPFTPFWEAGIPNINPGFQASYDVALFLSPPDFHILTKWSGN